MTERIASAILLKGLPRAKVEWAFEQLGALQIHVDLSASQDGLVVSLQVDASL